MVIVKMKTRHMGVFFALILVCAMGCGFYKYKQSSEVEKYFESLSSNVGEFGRDNLVSFLVSSDSDTTNKNIEIFDIAKGEVVREIEANPVARKEAEGYLAKITGMFGKVKAFPEKGYIVRVPLEPSAQINNKWLTDYGINSLDQVFIIFPEQTIPYLLVLDEKNRPLFFNFEGSINTLLENLNLKL